MTVAIPRFFKKDQADWGKKVTDQVSSDTNDPVGALY